MLGVAGGMACAWPCATAVRERFDAGWLTLPLVGRLARGYNAARFAGTLAMLAGAGVPILKALQAAAETLGNRAMRADAMDALVLVREGAPLASALAGRSAFPACCPCSRAWANRPDSCPACCSAPPCSFRPEVQRRALALATHPGAAADRGHGPGRDADRAGGAAAHHPAQPVGTIGPWPRFPLDDKLVVAISSRALFDFEEENRVFESGDPPATCGCNCSAWTSPPRPASRSRWCASCSPSTRRRAARRGGRALAQRPGVRHARVPLGPGQRHPPAARRVHAGPLALRYLRPLKATLFLSANADDVRAALAAGFPAARVLTESVWRAPTTRRRCASPSTATPCCSPTRPSRCSRRAGLEAFQEHESLKATQPLPAGPSSRC